MPQQKLTVTGRLACHRDGYGFVIPEDPSIGGDVFIPPGRMGQAMHGDQVVARVVGPAPGPRVRGKKAAPRTKLEGEIVKVLTRGRDVIVGKAFRYRGSTHVAPLDQRYSFTIQIPEDVKPRAKARREIEGKIVAVSLVTPPARHASPLGKIVDVLGDPDDPEIQYKIVCHTYQIPIEFPEAVLQEANAAEPSSERESSRRKDFRPQIIVTIDGEKARDFDDAVSVEQLPNGNFRLGVHIADVSHYVRGESQLDLEAFIRGTSVYFPDRAIPMLPEQLSNELCSLKPRVDRLTLSAVMEVDRQGNVRRADFCESVICSRARMTYTEVRKILIDRDPQLVKHYEDLISTFELMLELCDILTAKRLKKGAIDFDLPEAEIEYDLHGEVLDIVRSERNKAHRIIEEFMLLANEAVATYLVEKEIPLIFRIHEDPDPAKVEQFLEIAQKFGYGLERSGRDRYEPRAFQKLAGKLAGSPEEKFLSYLMLRSFKQARYSEVNVGHFGLAAENYTHFTSPIRRYPDLIVHRILKAALQGKRQERDLQRLEERLPEIAVQSSDRERKAVEAEREIMRWLMAQFMADRLGEEYEAFIIEVKHNGFFVELLDHFVEGFVPVQTIWDDYYIFDERHHSLVGENTRRVYGVGDRVLVRVDKVDPHRHLIDFSVVLTRRSPVSRGGRPARPGHRKQRR